MGELEGMTESPKPDKEIGIKKSISEKRSDEKRENA
jgi:hypothetical protein